MTQITTCPMCAEDVSVHATACPHCGSSIRSNPSPSRPLGLAPRLKYLIPAAFVVALGIVFAVMHAGNHVSIWYCGVPQSAASGVLARFNRCFRQEAECTAAQHAADTRHGHSPQVCQQVDTAYCIDCLLPSGATDERCYPALDACYMGRGAAILGRGCTEEPVQCEPRTNASTRPSASAGLEAAEGGAIDPTMADAERIPVGISPVIGLRSALVTIVEFGDFQCPHCSHAEDTVRQIRQTFGNDVRVVWKNNPLPQHDHASIAAEAAMEAYAQGGNAKFWQMHDLLYEHNTELDRSHLDQLAQEIRLDMGRYRAAMDNHTHNATIVTDETLAREMSVSETPTFFINGTRINGAQPFDRIRNVIDQILIRARTIQPSNRVYATMVADPVASPDSLPTATPIPADTDHPIEAPLRASPASATPGLARLVPDSATASSFISLRNRQYPPELAFDDSSSTAWNEGGRGPGDGEWIQANFSTPHTVHRIRMATGWNYVSTTSGDLFTGNSHLRRVRIVLDGRVIRERDVGVDEREITFEGLDVPTTRVRIVALGVWQGLRWSDLCLSEVAIEGDL